MIALVEGAERQKTPNEIALTILLAGADADLPARVATLQPFAIFSRRRGLGLVLIALLVCLIPTTIGGLLSAIGIAGMDRLVQHNVLAMSGRAVEAAGDIDTLLLDKTGTITSATARRPSSSRCRASPTGARRRGAARVARRRDARGPRIVELGQEGTASAAAMSGERRVRPFTARTRMSGIDPDGRSSARARATRSIATSQALGGDGAPELDTSSTASPRGRHAAGRGEDARVLGVVHLKDIVKPGMRERFDGCARWGSAP